MSPINLETIQRARLAVGVVSVVAYVVLVVVVDLSRQYVRTAQSRGIGYIAT